jgi:Glyoxalase/Bleomycin resistance protein/Dioxygenase superfamily
MFPRPHARHSQIAYVTTDMEQALAVWRDEFDVPEFYVFTNDAPGLEASHPYRLKIALANVGGMEIELIEPLDGNAMYSDPLPKDGSFAMRFHHICMRIAGPLANFEAHLASLDKDKHPVVYSGAMGDLMRYAYTDERRALGHYIEHVWFDDEFYSGMAAAIPSYPRN